MYRKYFGIRKAPFSIAPDPRYLYMSRQHKEALAHLLYGLHSDGGFVLLTGEVGAGKTTICRRLLERLTKNCVVAFIIHPTLSVAELLATVCDEFCITYPKKASVKALVDCINLFLLDAHSKRKKAILIIDEAQNLSQEVLEQIRLLTNLETNQRKLLQIILIGQPELRDKLARPEMRQLAQRIIARCHLGPLSRSEIVPYVNHRLAVSGIQRELFSPGSIERLHALSGGIPRLINIICDRALLGAYVQGKSQVDGETIARAAHEVIGIPHAESGWRRRAAEVAAAIALLVAVGLLAFQLMQHYPFRSETIVETSAQSSPAAVAPETKGETPGGDVVNEPEEQPPGDAPGSETIESAAPPDGPDEPVGSQNGFSPAPS